MSRPDTVKKRDTNIAWDSGAASAWPASEKWLKGDFVYSREGGGTAFELTLPVGEALAIMEPQAV